MQYELAVLCLFNFKIAAKFTFLSRHNLGNSGCLSEVDE